MKFIKDLDRNRNDRFVTASEQNTLFQCSPWADLKKSTWHPHFVGAEDENGELIATALVLVRPLVFGQNLMYIPRGPVMDWQNDTVVSFFINELKKYARSLHCAAVRFDPAVITRSYPYADRNAEHPAEHLDMIASLTRFGAVHRGFTTMIEESTQPRFNAEMDVFEGYEAKLEHRTRKCINAAVRKGIILRSGKEYVSDFASAMHYTEVRKKIALRNEEYFRQMLEVYGDKGICITSYLNFPKQIGILKERIDAYKRDLEGPLSKKKKAETEQKLAQDEKELAQLQEDYQREGRDEVITGGILGCYNDQLMELFYMGNNPDYLRMYSSYLLYKTCLDMCVEKGIRRCSFGGIEGTLDDGLTLFKSNWLMNVEEYIGEFNIVLNRPVYWMFDKAYPLALKTAARLRGRK